MEQNINKDTVVCISIAAKPGNFGANFHNCAYDLLDLNWVYIPRKVERSSDLERAINGVRSLGIRGCSVSMPHKETVIQHLDDLDVAAEKIGAVNTIKQNEDKTLKGYNTDFYGAKRALEGIGIKEQEVLMVGAGGVAKAIGLAVKEMGGELMIANRTYQKAKKLSEQLKADVITWEQLGSASGYLLINATSVGMRDPHSMIVSKEIIEKFDVIMDVVIYPARTKLLQTAKELGKQIIPGALMCVYQAAEQFKIYTGLMAPLEIISNTLETLKK